MGKTRIARFMDGLAVPAPWGMPGWRSQVFHTRTDVLRTPTIRAHIQQEVWKMALVHAYATHAHRKCTCLMRAPAAVGVLMAFGCAPRDGLPAERQRQESTAACFKTCRTVCMWC